MGKLSLCIAGAATVLAVATGVVSARSAASPTTFSLLDVTGKQRGLNGYHFQLPPRSGDQIAQTDQVYTWNGGKRGVHAGRVEMLTQSKTDLSRNGAVALLTAQVFLPSGSLFVEGYARFGGAELPATFPILGGTGTYASARGYVISRRLGADKTNLEFHLTD